MVNGLGPIEMETDCYFHIPSVWMLGLIHTLFVFQSDDPQQNGVKLLTPVSSLVFIALSDGTIHFALYGSSHNHNLIG